MTFATMVAMYVYIANIKEYFNNNTKNVFESSKYNPLPLELRCTYKQIDFIKLYGEVLGTVGSSSKSLIDHLNCI